MTIAGVAAVVKKKKNRRCLSEGEGRRPPRSRLLRSPQPLQGRLQPGRQQRPRSDLQTSRLGCLCRKVIQIIIAINISEFHIVTNFTFIIDPNYEPEEDSSYDSSFIDDGSSSDSESENSSGESVAAHQ